MLEQRSRILWVRPDPDSGIYEAEKWWDLRIDGRDKASYKYVDYLSCWDVRYIDKHPEPELIHKTQMTEQELRRYMEMKVLLIGESDAT